MPSARRAVISIRLPMTGPVPVARYLLPSLSVGFSKGRRNDEVGQRLTVHLVAAVAEDLLRRRVELDHPAGVIGRHDRIQRHLDDARS